MHDVAMRAGRASAIARDAAGAFIGNTEDAVAPLRLDAVSQGGGLHVCAFDQEGRRRSGDVTPTSLTGAVMTIAAGAIVKNKAGNVFLVETSSKRLFPDAATLGALTLGAAAASAPTLTDAALAAIPDGSAFASVAAYIAANPRVDAMVQRIVRALIPKTGIKDLNGGMMTVAESAAALFADAIANPGNWAAPVQGGNKNSPLPNGFEQAAAKVITNLLNKLLNQLIGQALSSTQENDVDDSVDQIGQEVDGSNDGDPLPAKDDGDKEDVKEAGDKDEGDKDEGDKEAGDKEAGDKEAGDKEAGDKEAGDKEAGDKEAGDKDGAKDGEKDGEKDDKDDDGDGGDGGEDDVVRRTPAPKSRPASKKGSRAAAARDEWDQFSA